jgi:hypothetical protein
MIDIGGAEIDKGPLGVAYFFNASQQILWAKA